MAIEVHDFTDLVNLQTVCKSTDLQVYKSIDSSCQNMDFHSPSIFQQKSQPALNITAAVTCLKSYCLKIHSNSLSSNECEYQKITTYILVQVCSPCIIAESTYMFVTQSAD